MNLCIHFQQRHYCVALEIWAGIWIESAAISKRLDGSTLSIFYGSLDFIQIKIHYRCLENSYRRCIVLVLAYVRRGIKYRSNTFKVHFRSKTRKRTNASFGSFQVERLTSNFDTNNKLMYKYRKWTQTVESYNLYRVKYNTGCPKCPPPPILLFF